MRVLYLLTVVAAIIGCTNPAFADNDVQVVTSIKPVHSLVAAVMDGVGTPHLIVEGGASPHTYSLKPSDAAAMEKAQVVFWVGPELEQFLAKPIATLAPDATVVQLDAVEDLTLLPPREGGAFEAHHHGAHGAEHEDDEDHHHAAADDAAADNDGPEHAHHDMAQHAWDPHLWLDPANARAMVVAIAATLAKVDPAHAATYQANAAAVEDRLVALTAEIDTALDPARGKPFIVFHDAYHYFENRFGVTAAGAITVNPEIPPSARRIAEIRATAFDQHVVCLFAEPQFEPTVVNAITEGTELRSGVLDPLGADLVAGPELYPALLQKMATSLVTCLAPAG